jgi:nucleotide-binding universal stress UspA family protein
MRLDCPWLRHRFTPPGARETLYCVWAQASLIQLNGAGFPARVCPVALNQSHEPAIGLTSLSDLKLSGEKRWSVTAVDGSAPSLRAVAFAADLAAKYGAELILLTVAREFSLALTAELEAYTRQENIDAPLGELGSAHAETVLAGARLEAQAKGPPRISTRSLTGDPAEEIIAMAKDLQPDLVAIGSRGHGRLAGLLLGSVAQKVLAHAACPVLVVR